MADVLRTTTPFDFAPGPSSFIAASSFLTLSLAAASWFLVEHPAMQRWDRTR